MDPITILAGLASLIGTGAGAYNLGTSIKDRNARKRAEAQQKQLASKKNARNNPAPNPGGNPPSGPGGGSNNNQSSKSGSTISDKLFGTQNRVEQFANRTPEQMAAQNTVLQQALANLKGNQYDFAPIEQLAQNNFQRNTIPSLAHQFSGSALNRQLASAGADLNSQLASLRSQHALGQQGLNQNLLKIGLAPQFDNAFFAGTPGFVDKFADSAFNPETLGNLAKWLQNAYANRSNGNGNDGNGGLPPFDDNNPDPMGQFSQNQQLQDFANQATSPSNPYLYSAQLMSGKNNNRGVANDIVQQGSNQRISQGKPSIRDVLKLLNPGANF